ncbi:hypothetical protein [Paludifilum halophilum]|uniref:Uncharacterized protein n=1 Tax=Paludifilum halophilum TaxID=1642702 RepID=A0A235B8D1_9BACL|nr:hypothetical protein [Paludifilum halophilum]OYD08560.1 hypothetical protein CHM34_06965 [Paludifilum halophilum]
MKKVSFTIEAKRYFETDAERLAEVKDGDLVLVEIDFDQETTNFTVYPEDENPANFPAEEDEFDAVVEAFKEEIEEAKEIQEAREEEEKEMKMKIINLTPHDLTVQHEDGTRTTFEKAETPARVATSQEKVDEVNGIEIVSQEFGEIEGLPEPQEGVVYLVSFIVRTAAQKEGRTDVLSPDTSNDVIRDKDGQIEAVRRFVR